MDVAKRSEALRRASCTLAAVTVLASVTVADARDWCVQTPHAIQYVGRRVRIPPPGRCGAWIGYTAAEGIPPNAATGTLCTASDGSHLTLGITTSFPQGVVLFETLRFPLPSLSSGFGVETSFTNPGSIRLNDLTLAPCSAPPVP